MYGWRRWEIWTLECFTCDTLQKIKNPNPRDSGQQEQEARYHLRLASFRFSSLQTPLNSATVTGLPLPLPRVCCLLQIGISSESTRFAWSGFIIYSWEEGINKNNILANRYPSSPLPPPSGHSGQTLSVKRDPLDLFLLAPLLDTLFWGT